MTPILVFDIETIPDVDGIRRLEDLPATLDDAAVAEHAFAARREKTGSDFLPHHCSASRRSPACSATTTAFACARSARRRTTKPRWSSRSTA
jgi:hypothetical protein